MKILRGSNLDGSDNLVELDEVKVPDLWHLHLELNDMHSVPAAEAVLETWRLANDLLANLRRIQAVPTWQLGEPRSAVSREKE